MNIDVHAFRRYRDVYNAERISVLHHIGLVSLLYCLGNHLTFDIAMVDKIILKISVCAVQHRSAEKALQRDVLLNCLKFNDFICDVSAKYSVNDRFQITITVCIKFGLTIYDILKRNLRS